MKTLVARLDETEASLSDATSDKKALADKIDALQAANTNLKGEVSNAQADVAQSKNNQAEMLARVNTIMRRKFYADSLRENFNENLEADQ